MSPDQSRPPAPPAFFMAQASVLAAVLSLLLPVILAAQATEEVRYKRDRITFEEIEAKAADAQSAYDIVQRLRPHMLHLRGNTGPATQRARQPNQQDSRREPVAVGTQVIVDGGRRGGVTLLREVLPNTVLEIAYFDGSDATTRFGSGYEGGVIVVRTGRRPTLKEPD